ncbi:uncharacterized protein BDR25DRAFT_349590 [Lindgomyces ingoldianus]|uniref:Uncharacterized protein n=1 Tax=Lindgomyces ingoldianus TaxID=673940 RepID=A0ACB6RDV7_9PLEO|nr:uncharacterized protein BDR25DRAFT_349590 [Lindgomyces ingoldianus]KAF2476510.1 hypothetical protein BDR25DRAFT_349590 [Lindgomyces ingoldianus]
MRFDEASSGWPRPKPEGKTVNAEGLLMSREWCGEARNTYGKAWRRGGVNDVLIGLIEDRVEWMSVRHSSPDTEKVGVSTTAVAVPLICGFSITGIGKREREMPATGMGNRGQTVGKTNNRERVWKERLQKVKALRKVGATLKPTRGRRLLSNTEDDACSAQRAEEGLLCLKGQLSSLHGAVVLMMALKAALSPLPSESHLIHQPAIISSRDAGAGSGAEISATGHQSKKYPHCTNKGIKQKFTAWEIIIMKSTRGSHRALNIPARDHELIPSSALSLILCRQVAGP